MILVSLFIFGSLTAEMIGNIEYHLPQQGEGWKIVNELQDSKKHRSTTIIYIPENSSRETAREFFGAHINNSSTDLILTDRYSLEKDLARGMQFQYPNPKVVITLLEEEAQSVLYEWSLSQLGQERVHGWNRIFTDANATIILSYQTEELNRIRDIRPFWVQTLKDAKRVK
jgi:hypothetical protein